MSFSVFSKLSKVSVVLLIIFLSLLDIFILESTTLDAPVFLVLYFIVSIWPLLSLTILLCKIFLHLFLVIFFLRYLKLNGFPSILITFLELQNLSK